MLRLAQIQNRNERCVALVDDPRLCIVSNFDSVYALAQAAIAEAKPLTALIREHLTERLLDYESIYSGQSDWHLMAPIDHPSGPSGTLVSGTGLTHFGSARDRQAMHEKTDVDDEKKLTDSMKMFRLGVEGGRPKPGTIGVAPEWFYKGSGSILRAHGEALEIPSYAEDGGEEAEIAGIYVIGADAMPWRIGMAAGNEFSDHQFEKRNYLNLAGSKMRTCSIGPEIVIDPLFGSIPGEVRIERSGELIWSKAIQTGEAEMCHSLRNIEHHHFKFDGQRRPGDVHVHYLGAHSLSYGDGLALRDGDVMSIRWDGFGRPLRNPVKVMQKTLAAPIAVTGLG